MDVEFENMYEEMKKMPKGAENSTKLMKKIVTMFGVSLEKSIDVQLHQRFWQAARMLIDEMNGAEMKIVAENVHNLMIGQFTALSIKVHGIYAIPDYGLPQYLTVSNVVVPRKRKLEKKWKARIFCGFLMLRLGDLMRYKGYISKAKEFYEISLKINHTDKETWNQLGVVHFKSADFLTAIYFHTRSLHASTVPFHAASANLDAIFKKFANRPLVDNQPIAEVAVICLARMHFLLDIENAEIVLENLGKALASEKSLIVSLMSIYEHLENGTQLEDRAIEHVGIVWECAFLEILHSEMTDENVQIIGLLLRAPEFCVVLEEEMLTRLEQFNNDVITDVNRFDTFQCLKEHRLQYPLNIKEVLRRCGGELEKEMERSEAETSFEDEQIETEEEEEDSFSTSTEEEDEDSDEEILRAGVRRQRVDIETDDEDIGF